MRVSGCGLSRLTQVRHCEVMYERNSNLCYSVYQTGLTGLTRFLLLFSPSRMEEQKSNENPIYPEHPVQKTKTFRHKGGFSARFVPCPMLATILAGDIIPGGLDHTLGRALM